MTTPKDAGAVEDVKKAKQQSALHDRIEDTELRQLLKLKAFRNFVWNLFADCGIDDGVFFGDANDAIFKDGKRSAARRVRDHIFIIDPSNYILMLKEHQKDHTDA